MGKISFAIAAVVASVIFSPAAFSQQQCYTVASFVAPNQLRRQAVGKDYLGKTIWLCC